MTLVKEIMGKGEQALVRLDFLEDKNVSGTGPVL